MKLNRRSFFATLFAAPIAAKAAAPIVATVATEVRTAFGRLLTIDRSFGPAGMSFRTMHEFRFHPEAFVLSYPRIEMAPMFKIGDTIQVKMPARFRA